MQCHICSQAIAKKDTTRKDSCMAKDETLQPDAERKLHKLFNPRAQVAR